MTRIAITAAAFEAIKATLPEDVPLWPVYRQNGQVASSSSRRDLRAMRTPARTTATPFFGSSRRRAGAPVGPSSIPSLGDGVMLGTAWIDRPVDTQGCAPCFHVLLSAAWKRGHAQANDRHSSRVFAMPPRGFARTTRNG